MKAQICMKTYQRRNLAQHESQKFGGNLWLVVHFLEFWLIT